MKKVTIKKVSDSSTLQIANFENDVTMNEWIEMLSINHPFGKPEHQVKVDENDMSDTAEMITVPSEYEVIIEDITLEVEKQNRIAQKIAIGQITDKACNDVFMLIQGYNVERQLSSEQKTEMTNLFLPALQAIQVRRPSQLKQYISSITPDGVLVTEEMKSDILELLSSF